jgi:hypothetical protein
MRTPACSGQVEERERGKSRERERERERDNAGGEKKAGRQGKGEQRRRNGTLPRTCAQFTKISGTFL